MNDDWTTVEEVLARLARANPDAERSERVRVRCHGALSGSSAALSESRGPAVLGSNQRMAPYRRALESAVVGGFCAVYLCVLTLIALRSRGLF